MACPVCQSEDVQKVLYLGLPMRLCMDESCNCLHGSLATAASWLPIASEDEYGQPAFAFFAYDGAYLPALWAWLTGQEVEA